MVQNPGDAAFDSFISKPWTCDFATHAPNDAAYVECILIEPRPMPNLVHVLRNLSHFLPRCALTVLHSQENAHLLPDNGNIRAIQHFAGNITINQYNDLLCSPEFWEIPRAPKVLIFQCDSALRANRLLDFVYYDYVGAPWNNAPTPCVFVGNGGFSLRSRTVMRDIAAAHAASRASIHDNEDVFFAYHLKRMGYKVPSADQAAAFSVEHVYHPDPMAMHQAWRFHKKEDVDKWFDVDPVEYTPPKITDAWFETPEGCIVPANVPDLRAWVSCGIGPCGVHIPQDTRRRLPVSDSRAQLKYRSSTERSELQEP